MSGMKLRLGRTARLFLLSTLAACLGSGIAGATCTPNLPITAGSVPCYITVQPIDVGTIPTAVTTPVYAPFNTTSLTGNPSTAGAPLVTDSRVTVPVANNAANNPTSPNPIGFVVDPVTGLFPGQTGYSGTGVDVTRALLNNIGVDLVWLPMNTVVTPGTEFPNNNFTTLNVVPTQIPNSSQVASCIGFISNTTLTVTSCSPISTDGGNVASTLAVYDFLSSGTLVQPGTFISALGTGSGGTGTYKVNISQTAGSSKKPITIRSFPGALGSPDLLTLADQNPSSTPPSPPCAISQMTIPLSLPCLTPPPPPLSVDPGTINLFFVNKLNPPAAGGTLYGFALIGNNGVAIGGNTFFAPTPLQARPDTIAHELLHDLGLTHMTYGAGPYNPQTSLNPFPPGGITPQSFVTNHFVGECDPNYPGCGLNLMTSGDLRTEPSLPCVLNGYMLNGAVVTTPGCAGQSAFPLRTADQVTSVLMEDANQNPPPTSPQLPVSQQKEVLAGGSGLLQTPPPPGTIGGLSEPIPYETTTAQLETGDSPTGRVIFDLSGPVDGRPGETLTAWILSLPEDHAFAGQAGVDVISQSRKDLVQDVSYYPETVKNPLRRNIAYTPGADNNADTPAVAAGPSPCAATTAACIVVKFEAPGLGVNDSFSFSQKILGGAAPMAKDDLCKTKITYVFSDGYTTTSNFGRCLPDSRPLIASSWRPDPHVAPHVVKTNLLLAQQAPTLPCTPVLVPNSDPPAFACLDPTTTPPEDADPTQEGGQLGQSCDGGATIGSINVSGTVPGPNITVGAGQRCNYANCEFLGSLTINGGNVFLGSCQIDGNLTMTSGTLNLSTSTQIIGNVQIANGSAVSLLPNSFTIGPSAQIGGGLTIQNLPGNEPGLVCGTTVSGGITLNNNQSPIQIGSGQQSCPGNAVAGGLNCKNNTAVTGGGNMVSGSISPQCASLVQ